MNFKPESKNEVAEAAGNLLAELYNAREDYRLGFITMAQFRDKMQTISAAKNRVREALLTATKSEAVAMVQQKKARSNGNFQQVHGSLATA